MAVVVEAVIDPAAAVVNADDVVLVSVVVDATAAVVDDVFDATAVVVVVDVTEAVDVSVAVDVHLHKRDFFPSELLTAINLSHRADH